MMYHTTHTHRVFHRLRQMGASGAKNIPRRSQLSEPSTTTQSVESKSIPFTIRTKDYSFCHYCTGIGIEQQQQQSFGSINELIEYAGRVIHLDDQRIEFLQRHHGIVSQLLRNELVGKNRFRELFLGSKGVGKTSLLQVLAEYTIETCPQVLVVLIRYHIDTSGILETVLARIGEKYPSLHNEFSAVKGFLLSEEIANFERLLQRYNLKFLLLVDEFQFVYKQPRGIGTQIIREIAALSDSCLGVNHIILSGSSTDLPKLAFATLTVDEKTQYPSFEGIDLNSTKLRPHWIFPIAN